MITDEDVEAAAEVYYNTHMEILHGVVGGKIDSWQSLKNRDHPHGTVQRVLNSMRAALENYIDRNSNLSLPPMG